MKEKERARKRARERLNLSVKLSVSFVPQGFPPRVRIMKNIKDDLIWLDSIPRFYKKYYIFQSSSAVI